MILIKILLLQAFWFFVVLYGSRVSPLIQISLALVVVFLDYFFFKPKVSYGRYLFLGFLFALFGFLNDSSLVWLNLITKDSYQYGNLSLWLIFLIYYEQVFFKFQALPLLLVSAVGGIAGAFTYWTAARLGAITIVPGHEVYFIIYQAFFWSVLFPMSIKIYFTDRYWDVFLDKTIFFSFDRSGFLRHKNKFTENLENLNLTGKTALVTGGTSGIGAEAGSFLSRIGVKLFITGRNEAKGREFEEKNTHSKFVSLDMAQWEDLHEFSKNCDVFDYLVFNAGSMPENLIVTNKGIEFQCASQLLGHYYLLFWLKEFKKIKKGTRVVWVSSGGMYLKELDLESLFINEKYEKVDTYANVKRAQVTLVEELAKRDEWDDYFIYSMHPGWVATKGLEDALPRFYKFMIKRLRTASEGADTILWCLLTRVAPRSGDFYFDRKKASPYISKKYIPSVDERNGLMRKIKELMLLNLL